LGFVETDGAKLRQQGGIPEYKGKSFRGRKEGNESGVAILCSNKSGSSDPKKRNAAAERGRIKKKKSPQRRKGANFKKPTKSENPQGGSKKGKKAPVGRNSRKRGGPELPTIHRAGGLKGARPQHGGQGIESDRTLKQESSKLTNPPKDGVGVRK